MTTVRCPAGHELADGRRRSCPRCRRDDVINRVAVAEPTVSRAQVAAAVDAAARNYAGLRYLATALAADRDALAHGAPPVVGRLVTELIARGSTALTVPACAVCGRTGRPLSATETGGLCQRCAARRAPLACVRCGIVKPVAGRTADGQPDICVNCYRMPNAVCSTPRAQASGRCRVARPTTTAHRSSRCGQPRHSAGDRRDRLG